MQLLDRDVLHARLGSALVLVDPLQVAVDQAAHGEERLTLDRLPLISELRRRGRAQDVSGAADRAPLDALQLVR